MLHPIAPITGRRIRIALVGCGRISRNHIKAIAVHHERAELVAICDTQPERLEQAQQLIAEAAAEHIGAATNTAHFNSYSELLEAAKTQSTPVDLVVLATPSGLHPGQVIAAAEAGLHVCTEKPMATRWTDGLAMVQSCDGLGFILWSSKTASIALFSLSNANCRRGVSGSLRWWR